MEPKVNDSQLVPPPVGRHPLPFLVIILILPCSLSLHLRGLALAKAPHGFDGRCIEQNVRGRPSGRAGMKPQGTNRIWKAGREYTAVYT